MKLSVIISTYNGKGFLAELLPSLQKSLHTAGVGAEVLLRDDNSSDGSADFVADSFPWLTLIRGAETLGFVKSNNIAFFQSSGEILCCLNQDTILTPEFIKKGLSALADRPNVAGINTNMIMPWIMDKPMFQTRAAFRTLPTYEYQLTKYGFAGYFEVDPTRHATSFMTGGAFFLRRSALLEGEALFDPTLHMYCEDTDLSLRLTERGNTLLYEPGAALFHNQIAKHLSARSALYKLFSITGKRFQVLARHLGQGRFIKSYPLYLIGIIKKNSHMGLSASAQAFAFFPSLLVALIFLFLLPVWWVKAK